MEDIQIADEGRVPALRMQLTLHRVKEEDVVARGRVKSKTDINTESVFVRDVIRNQDVLHRCK